MSKYGYSIAISSLFLALHGCGVSHREDPELGLEGAKPNGGHAGSRPREPIPAGARGGNSGGAAGGRVPPGACAGTVPTVVLSTRAGEQPGEQGSFCLSNERAGCGICADVAGGTSPKQFTIAHSGDEVTLRVLDGTFVTPADGLCAPDCPPHLRIVSLGCGTGTAETRTLGDGDVWQIDLSPGAYQIFVDAHFVSEDDTHGQTSVMFGLIVDDAREPAIVDGGSQAAVSCGDGGEALSCSDRTAKALALVEAALEQSTLECVEDSDCTVVPTNTRCSSGCATLTNRSGADAIEAAIEQAEASICGSTGQCPSRQIPCPSPPGDGLASCVAGACVGGAPSAWEVFSIERQTGTPGNFSTPLKCEAEDCILWAVTPDRRITLSMLGQMRKAQLSDADFGTLDAVLRSAEIRGLGMGGTDVPCEPPPPDQQVAISIQRSGSILGRDVTGCVLTGPANNAFQKLYEIVRGY